MTESRYEAFSKRTVGKLITKRTRHHDRELVRQIMLNDDRWESQCLKEELRIERHLFKGKHQSFVRKVTEIQRITDILDRYGVPE